MVFAKILMSLHRKAELPKQLLEVVDVQPGAQSVGVDLRPEEGLVVDEQGAAPEHDKVKSSLVGVLLSPFLGVEDIL